MGNHATDADLAADAGGTARAEDHVRWGLRLELYLLLTLCAALLSGCTKHVALAPGQNVVIILVSGTSNEPRPMLTVRAMDLLGSEADRSDVRSTVAVVVNADGNDRRIFPLTPMREGTVVEHGFRRKALIEANIERVADAVGEVTASTPGLDLLDAADRETRTASNGTLIVVSNGLTTAGGFDARRVDWLADPETVARDLADGKLLPALHGWGVLWVGLNEHWGDQPKLPKPARDANAGRWSAICRAAGAASCEFDPAPVTQTAPISTVRSYVVPVPRLESIDVPGGRRIEVPVSLLGFGPNSAVLGPGANETVAELAATIAEAGAGHSVVIVTITGFAADPPGSRAEDCQILSLRRAAAVAGALRAMGVMVPIQPVGGGIAPGASSVRNGRFVEALARPMRRVEVEVKIG